MVEGWRRLLRAMRERGQSEVLGAVLLTGIVVVLVGTAGVFFFTDLNEDDEQLLANIEGEVTAERIALTHNGGDSFDSEEIGVVLTGDSERELGLKSDFSTSQSSDNLVPGDDWQHNTSGNLILGSGRLLVIHEPTNTVLLSEGYRVEVAPGGIELRVESFNHSSPQSDEADVYGEGDSSNDDDGVRWDYEAYVDFDDDGKPVKNPSEIDISFDSSAPLEHNLTDHDLVAYDPSSDPETVTVTASVDGFSESDSVAVNVYEAATVDVTIDDISVAGSGPAPSPDQGPLRTLGVESADDSVQVPRDGSIDVTVTVSNTAMPPVRNETVEFTGSALQDDSSTQFERIESEDSKTETVTLALKNITGKETLKINPDSGDTVTRTMDMVESLFQATDLVPNAKQQQTFTFTLDTGLSKGQKVTITPDTPAGQDVYGSASAFTDDGPSDVTAEINNGDIEYKAVQSPVPAGTDVRIRVTQVNAGDVASGPYEYQLSGPDTDESTQSSVARGTGDPGLKNLDVETITSVGKQKLNISFEPTTDPENIDGKPEVVAIDLTDALGSLNTSNAGVKSVDNGDTHTVDLDDGSYVGIKLGSSYSSGDTVEVTLKEIEPVSEGEFEVGFSRGANDTASEPLEIEPNSQVSSVVESVEATDIVPNANEQQQELRLTINSSVDPSELSEFSSLDLKIDGHQSDSGQIGYGSVSATVPGDPDASISTDANDDIGNLIINYENKSELSPGDTVTIRVTGITADSLASQSDPYQVTVSPSDRLTATNTTFNVSRSGSPADAGLASLNIEALAGTNTQAQEISFKPDGTFNSGEKVAIEFNEAYIDGGLTDINDIQVVSGSGGDDESVSFDIDGGNHAYLTYKPGSEFGGVVTIELQGVNPDQAALGESYTAGVSRGSSGTAGATFGVFQPAQFNVSIQEEESFLGTFYGSENSGLSVTAEVENNATYEDTQTITLDVGPTQNVTKEITLGPDDSREVTLSDPNIGVGNYTANISSETDSDQTDARVLENEPELLAGFADNGTDGGTLSVDLNVASFDGEGGDEFGSYTIAFSYDDSALEYTEVSGGQWADPAEINEPENDAVSAADFNAPSSTPAEPALTFEFDISTAGTTDIQFDDSNIPVDNSILDGQAELYDVLFLNGTVEAGPAS
jgi:flagellin-like protein